MAGMTFLMKHFHFGVVIEYEQKKNTQINDARFCLTELVKMHNQFGRSVGVSSAHTVYIFNVVALEMNNKRLTQNAIEYTKIHCAF